VLYIVVALSLEVEVGNRLSGVMISGVTVMIWNVHEYSGRILHKRTTRLKI